MSDWVTPSEYEEGDLITAAIWNQSGVYNAIAIHNDNISGVSLAKTGTQAVNSGTAITWATVSVENGEYVDLGTSASAVNIPYDGIYMISVYAVADAACVITMTKNAGAWLTLGTANTALQYATILSLAADDVLALASGTDSKTIQADTVMDIKLMAKL